MLNNLEIIKLNFPNLGLGYYIVIIFFLLTLLYKGREGVEAKTKEKYERILFTTLLSIFLFLLICITITDIDLFKDAMLYKIGFPKFLAPIFKYIGIYRNLIITLVLIIFLFVIVLYLYFDFIVHKKYKHSKAIFCAVMVIATVMEIYDFGAHYVKDLIKLEMEEEFSADFNEIVNASKEYKYLIDVNRKNLPPYTETPVKALCDFVTYHNLKSNIGLYSRNYKKDPAIYNVETDIDKRYKYEIRDDAIYVFEGPCFMECKNYNLTYYVVNNYLIGVTKPFGKVEKKDEKDTSGELKMITYQMKQISDIDAFLKKYSKHSLEIMDNINYAEGKTHAMILLQCKYCEHSEEKFNRSTGHIFTEYIDNNDARANVHGTRTSTCICKEEISEPVQDAILGHKYEMKTLRTPTNAEPGLRALTCAICGKTLTGTEKYTYVELEYDEVLYDGESHEPKLIIKDNDGNVLDESMYQLKYSDTTEVGSASIDVRFNDKDNADYLPFKVYYYIKPHAPEIIEASRDKDILTVKFVRPTSKYDGIDIAYSDYDDFADEYTKHFDLGNKNKEEVRIKNLDEGKRFVKIRSYKKAKGEIDMNYSDWSKTLIIE